MSSSSAVASAWNLFVFENATIQAITSKIYAFEVDKGSEAALAQAMEGQKVNFIEYVVTRTPVAYELGNATEAQFEFLVEIRYTLEQQTVGETIGGTNHIAMRDFYDTLLGVVSSSLGQTWNGTVDYFEYPTEQPQITAEDVASIQCWRSVYRFKGVQFTTI